MLCVRKQSRLLEGGAKKRNNLSLYTRRTGPTLKMNAKDEAKQETRGSLVCRRKALKLWAAGSEAIKGLAIHSHTSALYVHNVTLI